METNSIRLLFIYKTKQVPNWLNNRSNSSIILYASTRILMFESRRYEHRPRGESMCHGFGTIYCYCYDPISWLEHCDKAGLDEQETDVAQGYAGGKMRYWVSFYLIFSYL